MCELNTIKILEINKIPCKIDACIYSIVKALNDAGITTTESCCGHGKQSGIIFLADGRELTINRNKRRGDGE